MLRCFVHATSLTLSESEFPPPPIASPSHIKVDHKIVIQGGLPYALEGFVLHNQSMFENILPSDVYLAWGVH